MAHTTDRPTRRTNRRRFLSGLGAAGVALGTLPGVTLAGKTDEGGRQGLETGPLDFKIYSSLLGDSTDSDPNTTDEFGYPDTPMFRFHDHSGTAFFDPSQIEMTPNGNTLHHALQFFNGWLIDRHPKPYTLVHGENGRYTERGQTMNFTAKSFEEIQAQLAEMAEKLGLTVEEVSQFLDPAPLAALAGERWRAVGNDVVQLAAKGEPVPLYALTRIDFYTHGDGTPRLAQSLVYVIWADPNATATDFEPGPIPGPVDAEARAMIEAGKANLGGQ